MQLKQTANLALCNANAILLSSILFGLITALYCSSIYADTQIDLVNASYTNDTQRTSIINALNNPSLLLKDQVTQLYKLRNYNLIWSNGQQYNENARELYKIIRQADKYGLSPADYDVNVIQYFLQSTISDLNFFRKSDVTFTHAYIKLASHLGKGKYSKTRDLQDKEYALIEILSEAVENKSISKTIGNLKTNHSRYTKLALALNKYRSFEYEHQPIVLDQKSLAISDQSPEIIKLRKRLHDYGDYTDEDLHSDVLDEPIALAITNFQNRHGLKADGILGEKTVRELNIPIAYRIQQLELNLERARHLPDISQGRHLIINIPDYNLYVVDSGQTIYKSRVVVGKKKDATPVLTSGLTELVLNPYWNVPFSIASKEIIPKMQQDPEYLVKNNMQLLGFINNQTHVISPEAIDWSTIDFSGTPLRIRQAPGSRNSLGRIKFIFPNAYSIYLHDTPSRSLFSRNHRAFSHGCVRVEDPFGLAKVLLPSQDAWSKDDLYYSVKHNKTKTVKLDNPTPIHIIYMTAWVDDQNVINFRPDIYKRDSQIASTLYNAPQ